MADGTHRLLAQVRDDVKSRSEWARKDSAICRRRLGERPATKQFPYPGAPNFVEPVIDDVTREKTDQEISMMFNPPRLGVCLPLAEMPPMDRAAIEEGFDSYLRHIIKIRPKLEEATDTKNARGFAVLKQVRVYNDVMKRVLPDIEVRDIRMVIVPADTRHIQQAERLTDVIFLTERDLRNRVTTKNWRHVDELIAKLKEKGRDGDSSDPDHDTDTFEEIRKLVGLENPEEDEYVLIFEQYHYATAEDVAEAQKWGFDPEIEVNRRIVTVYSPKMPETPLSKYAWKEEDSFVNWTEQELKQELVAAATEGRQPRPYKTVVGQDRSWPFVQPRLEQRSRLYYDTRGAGHLCMDDQIAATQMRNAKATQLDFHAKPLFESTGTDKNTANVTFEPGSVLPNGIKPVQNPPLDSQLDFGISQHRAAAGKRMAAAGQYNISEEASARRKVQKTATEVDTEQQRAANVSSASVDRFNDPMAEMYQLLIEDLVRMKVKFPVIRANQTFGGIIDMAGYAAKGAFLMVPAASARTLNPDAQLAKSMAVANFLKQFENVVPMEWRDILTTTLSLWDSKITANWISGPDKMAPLQAQLQQLMDDVKLLAQGGSDLSKRLGNVEQLAVKLSKQTSRGNGNNGTQRRPSLIS